MLLVFIDIADHLQFAYMGFLTSGKGALEFESASVSVTVHNVNITTFLFEFKMID